MKIKILTAVFAFFHVSCLGGLPEVEELSVYYKKEVIDGKSFVYREDVANGVKKQVWSIDGRAIDYDEYEDAILDAEREIRKRERRAEAVRRSMIQQERLQASIDLHKKLLRLMITQTEEVLKKFDDHRLVPFLVFDEASGFSQEEFESIEIELVKDAKGVLSFQDYADVGPLAAMIDKLDGISDRLDVLFQKTVNGAIRRCDDTRMLKGLLKVVSGNH